MHQFVESLSQLQQFSLGLRGDQFTLCQHCHQSGNLISHGFIYKKQQQSEPQVIGKRIFCSNRTTHRGCGRTTPLYLSIKIPRKHYQSNHLFTFIKALLAYCSISEAYRIATGSGPRHAYRWLNSLNDQLDRYRYVIKRNAISFTQRTVRLQQLLPVMHQLQLSYPQDTCAQFQLNQQIGFM